MTAQCSHDSTCLQCPAESWERSKQPCDVNRQKQCQPADYNHRNRMERRRQLCGSFNMAQHCGRQKLILS